MVPPVQELDSVIFVDPFLLRIFCAVVSLSSPSHRGRARPKLPSLLRGRRRWDTGKDFMGGFNPRQVQGKVVHWNLLIFLFVSWVSPVIAEFLPHSLYSPKPTVPLFP